MSIVTLSERGQLVIPQEIRRKLELSRGSQLLLEFHEEDRAITLRPIPPRKTLRGFLKGTPSTAQMLRTVRREEREREERLLGG